VCYILFFGAVFALAWVLDPPLIVRAEKVRSGQVGQARFQDASGQRQTRFSSLDVVP
jgi:hypothetical protein